MKTSHSFIHSGFAAALALSLVSSCDSKVAKKDTHSNEANQPTEPLKAVAATKDDLPKYLEGLGDKGAVKARFTTSMGTIECTLEHEKAPITVANFVGLTRGLHPFKDNKAGKVVKRPFYDGLIFHRVIPEFMIQGGDQDGSGMGGPGFVFPTEVSPELSHDKPGTLAMANSGPNTNGSQFYITDVPVTRLDGGYNVFGYCDNIDVIMKIARVPTSRGTTPTDNVTMDKVEIFRAE